MKKPLFIFSALLFILFWGCESTTNSDVAAEVSQEKQFVWNGLNLWYFWQENVPELADDRFPDDESLNEFLSSFSNERELFEALIYRTEDDFSIFIDNYEEFEQAQQGRSESFGFSFGLVQIDGSSSEVFGYVQYVFDPSAEQAGLSRGDIFTRVGDTQITVNNYQSLLNGDNLELTMSEIEDTNPLVITDTGETVDIQAMTIQENPVYLSRILETGSATVGYLVFNSFRFNYHEELNNAFGEFSAEGVDELVLDLRYNAGGAVVTSTLLASMISGQDDSTVFAEFMYNEKQEERNELYYFLEEVPVWDQQGEFVDWFDNMNQLSLDRVHVLTSRATASASETLINGLAPFMDVILIGQQTVGKDEGSVTLYDSPPDYNDKDLANPDHMRAMQPIVFKIFNERLEDYPNGFFPQEEIREIDYLDDLPPLGDENEPLLARALQLINGEAVARIQPSLLLQGEIIIESRNLTPIDTGMYILPHRNVP